MPVGTQAPQAYGNSSTLHHVLHCGRQRVAAHRSRGRRSNCHRCSEECRRNTGHVPSPSTPSNLGERSPLLVPFDRLRAFDSALPYFQTAFDDCARTWQMACHERAQRVEWRRRESNLSLDRHKHFANRTLQRHKAVWQDIGRNPAARIVSGCRRLTRTFNMSLLCGRSCRQHHGMRSRNFVMQPKCPALGGMFDEPVQQSELASIATCRSRCNCRNSHRVRVYTDGKFAAG